ncbi:hypothetical protein [Bradyrhizobium sp.]|uniref:hypothetical protein n=1 Tax=Bradyrhizobium sp. TaxID=376 RepID=UPI003C47FCD3
MTPRDRPLRLAGYHLREAPVAAVLDPIEVSVLLLECGEQRCLIFSFDLMLVGSELQDLILARLGELGFAPHELVLLASHTHNAPATDQACHRLGIPDDGFVEDTARATEDLVRRLLRQPACEVEVEIFRGLLDHSINRRRFWPYPTIGRMHGFKLRSVVFSPNPSGPRDEQATVVLLRKTGDGEALGVIWHYTCHPTAVVPDSVISSDYPGAVRDMLRQRFGQIPCVFAQGFCGNIRPNIAPSPQKFTLRERFQKLIRVVVFGNLFPILAAGDWIIWSKSLAAGVDRIVTGNAARTLAPARLKTGMASIPLGQFFTGKTPNKRLTAQIIQISNALEIVALSAEPTVEWECILDEVIPALPGTCRLYVGYLGALYGYLPTDAQVREGGYEVEGFQPLFGLSGHFEPDLIGPAVVACVKGAFEDLERSKPPVIEGASRPSP